MKLTPERSTDRATARRVPATPGALAELARHRSHNMPTLESFLVLIDASLAELERRGLVNARTIIKLNAVATEIGFGEVADPMWAWPGAMPYWQLEDVLGRGPRSRLRTLRERIKLRMAAPRPVGLADDQLMTAAVMADRCEVPLAALRKSLERWRDKSDTGWKKRTDNWEKSFEYEYRFGAVKHIVAKLRSKASTDRPR